MRWTVLDPTRSWQIAPTLRPCRSTEREPPYRRGQEADALIQKLGRIAFTLDDEESGVTIVDASGQVRSAFDVEPVTKRFYDEFQGEHSASS